MQCDSLENPHGYNIFHGHTYVAALHEGASPLSVSALSLCKEVVGERGHSSDGEGGDEHDSSMKSEPGVVLRMSRRFLARR